MEEPRTSKVKADFYIGTNPADDDHHELSCSGPPFYFSLSEPNDGSHLHFPAGSPEATQLYCSPSGAKYYFGLHDSLDANQSHSRSSTYSFGLVDSTDGNNGQSSTNTCGLNYSGDRDHSQPRLQNGFSTSKSAVTPSRSHNSLQIYFGESSRSHPEDYNGNVQPG